MAERAELGDSFGNYLLHGIDEVFMPAAVSLWPQTVGWKVLFVLLLLIAAYYGWRSWQRWQKNWYRREGVEQLKRIQVEINQGNLTAAGKIAELLKMVALQAYPRSSVAQLSGKQWLLFLQQCLPNKEFASGEVLLTIAYNNPQQWQLTPAQLLSLVNDSHTWITQHQALEPIDD